MTKELEVGEVDTCGDVIYIGKKVGDAAIDIITGIPICKPGSSLGME